MPTPSTTAHHPLQSAKPQHGFTLIEILVTLSILVLITTLGVSGFNSLAASNRIATRLNDFNGALQFTRSEAVTRATTVSICKSTDGATCNNAANWEGGWIIFVDSGGDGSFNAGTDTLIRVRAGFSGATTLRPTGSNADNRVTYKALGNTGNVATFIICDNTGISGAKGLVIGGTGRIRKATSSEITAVGSCTP